MKESPSDRPRRSPSRSKNTFVTRSGKTIKVNRSLNERLKAGREAKARRKAAYLSSLPADPLKRLLFRISPKRIARYWFSREGAIMALKITGIGFVVMFLLIVGVFAYFRKDLPEIKDISGNTFGGSITYYDRTGQTVLFQDFDTKKRVPVEGKNISNYMKWATIAIEDKNFYKHGAFDTRGIMRAIVNDVRGTGSTQGGSTITQQLVKINEDWGNDRTISRKVKELILAVELEREYSKDEILIGYLNMAPYGNVDYGVETAAQDYFHVSAKDLTLAQAAMLAGIPKAPGSLSPFSSPQYNPSLATNYFNADALIGRKNYILDVMAQQGYITDKEAEEAKKVDVLSQVKQLQSHYANIKAPYFVLAARDELLKSFPTAVVKRGGWKVITTIDLNLQNIAETAYNNGQPQLRRQGADNAAFVAEDTQSGQVVALIGGRGLDTPGYGEINYATDVNISPGSSIKPYDYAAFIDNNTNVGAGSVLYDTVGALPGYPCTNRALPPNGNCLWDFDRRSPGPVTLRYALGGSRNIPAIKAFVSSVPNDTSSGRTTSINKTMSTIGKLMQGHDNYRCFRQDIEDITQATKADETQCYASAGIGDGAYLHLDEHVNGIASLGRMGKAIPNTYILKVTNSSGKVLKEFKQPKPVEAVKEDTAYIVNDMSADPGASYLSGSCTETNCYGMKFHRYKGWKTAIKTGTTNDLYDGLMVAWNTKFTTGIWVGNHSRTVAYSGQPEYMTDPIMKEFMQKALDTAGPAVNWQQPAGIKTAAAYVNRAAVTGAQSVPSRSTDLFPSWYVGKATSKSQVLDKVSGKLATSCTPELAKQSSLNSNATSWNVDVFSGGSAGGAPATQGADDVHNCNDAKPSISITAINGAATSSQAGLTCPQAGCSIMAHIEQGTHALTDASRPSFPGTLSLLVNGQSVQSQAVSATGDYQFTYTPASDSGDSVQISVQVTDSVLYQGSDNASVAITKPSSVSSGSGGSGDHSGP
ncbi:penicillin-binding protein [Candidatus Saccharibacteria bacterium]|nr:penicillin-binding protein [Candidatus Saccharibacteria bacterium]